MLSPIGYNINAQGVRDKGRLLAHLERLRPAWLLVMDGVGLAVELKQRLPQTQVIHRAWPDDGVPGETPTAWVARKVREVGGADVWCYTSNEPPANDALFRWHVETVQKARQAGLKLVVGNFAVGQPEPAAWARAHELLGLLGANPEALVLGLHEYACGFALSGAPGFEGLIAPGKWPENPRDLGKLYHCGRFQFLMDYCRDQGMRPPRIVMTEAGFDDLSDVAAWRDTLAVTPPYGRIRGWKTLPVQWAKWWPQWSAERAYGEQLDYLWRGLYDHSPVEALLLFTWSSATQWEAFDVSEAGELHRYLEARMMSSVDVNPGVDDARWRPYTAQSAPNGTNVRQSPTVSSAVVATVRGEVAVQHIPAEAMTAAERARAEPMGALAWRLIKIDETQAVGWARSDVITLKAVATPPPVEPEPEPAVVTPAMLTAALGALKAELQAWARSEFAGAAGVERAIDTKLAALGERLTAAWGGIE